MSFQDRLEFVKKEVEKKLAAFFVKKEQEAKTISPHCEALVDQVKSLTLRGGKRTRAFLVWVGNDCGTSKDIGYAMMAVELFQSFVLIHDDIIDEDVTRRGGPTVHVQLGVSMAILAGDLALAWADELMGKTGEMSIYHQMKQEVIFGQSLDVMEEHLKIGIPKKLIDVYKTAWYTVIRPLQIGAAIGGAGEKTLASFVPYGLAVGEAYQLRDDFLDGVTQEREFQNQVNKLKKQADQAIKTLKISKYVTILLVDFANFVLHRSA